jgi:serine/threonine-protein kinase
MSQTPADPEKVRAALSRILASRHFAQGPRMSGFLRLIVEKTLGGEAAEIKEFLIATLVYERDASYDSRVDSIVRVEASRLRSRLQAYYAAEGKDDPIRIELPKGAYVPLFTEAQPEAVAEPATMQPQRPSRRAWLIGGVSSAAAAAAFLALRTRPVSALPVAMLMTAEPGPRAGASADADRLTLELANALGRQSGLKVVRSDNPTDMRDRSREVSSPFYVVALTGQCWEAPDRVRVVMELRETSTADALWSSALDDRSGRTGELAEESAKQIGSAVQRLAVAGAVLPERRRAQDLLIRARQMMGDDKDFLQMTAVEAASSFPLDELMQIVRLLERAIAEDPSFVSAHARLGEVYRLASEYDDRIYPKSQAAVEAALRLDPGSAEANYVRGYCAFFVEWNFVAAEAALGKAIERSRFFLPAYRHYVDAAILTGRADRGAEVLACAASVLPRSLTLTYAAIMLANHRRDYAESERLARGALAVHPRAVSLRCQLCAALARQAKWREAEDELAQAAAEQPRLLRTWAARAGLYALQGRRDEALAAVRESNLEKRGPAIAGMIHARLGDPDRAFYWLEAAAREHNDDLPFATLEPEFESLRQHPRAVGILRHLRTRD